MPYTKAVLHNRRRSHDLNNCFCSSVVVVSTSPFGIVSIDSTGYAYTLAFESFV